MLHIKSELICDYIEQEVPQLFSLPLPPVVIISVCVVVGTVAVVLATVCYVK